MSEPQLPPSPSPKKWVTRVRTLGWIEGGSYLLLLGVAMPLKYLAGIDMAVKVVGWAHGALFIGLAGVTLVAILSKQLRWIEGVMVGIASLLPFGPLLIDKKLLAAAARES